MAYTADSLITRALTRGEIGNLLLEDRLAFLATKYKDKIPIEHDTLAKHKDSDAILGHFATKSDPTPNKQYTDWIISKYSKGQFRQEDHRRVHQALSDFHVQKARLPQKDLGQYKTLQDVERAVGRLKPPKEKVPWAGTEKEQAAVRRGSKKVVDSPELAVREVRTHPAMKALGSGTQWCTVPNRSYFNMYKRQGKLYHVHDKADDKRYLFHAESGQFMDEADRSIDSDALITKHQDLLKLPGVEKYYGSHTTNKDYLDRVVNAPRHPLAHLDVGSDQGTTRHDEGTERLRNISSNRNLTPEQVDKLADHPDKEVRNNISHHGNMSGDTIHRLVVAGAKELDEMPSDHLDKWRTVNRVSRLAQHPNVHLHTLELAADNPRILPEIGHALAGSRKTPSHLLDKLYDVNLRNNHFSWVDSDLANHENSSPELLDKLADSHMAHIGDSGLPSHSHRVAANLLRNKNTLPSTIRKIVEPHMELKFKPSGNIRGILYSATDAPNSPSYIIDKLARHKDASIRSRALMHDNITPQGLLDASNTLKTPPPPPSDRWNTSWKKRRMESDAIEGHRRTRKAILNHPKSPPEALRNAYLYHHPNPNSGDDDIYSMHSALIAHPHTPDDIIRGIAVHPDAVSSTRERARQRLEKVGIQAERWKRLGVT